MADDAYRQCLQKAIAVIASQAGYTTVSKAALETLTEMLQSVMYEIGHSSQAFCEISSRTKPTLSDVEQTLINTVGFSVQDVSNYFPRASAHQIPAPEKQQEKAFPKLMTIGTPQHLPSYAPEYLLPLPSPYTYIRTPTYKLPMNDYAAVRKRQAEDIRYNRNSIIQFIVKTSNVLPLIHDDGFHSLLIKSNPSKLSYINALLSTKNDEQEVDSMIQGQNTEDSQDDDGSTSTLQNPFLDPPVKR